MVEVTLAGSAIPHRLPYRYPHFSYSVKMLEERAWNYFSYHPGTTDAVFFAYPWTSSYLRLGPQEHAHQAATAWERAKSAYPGAVFFTVVQLDNGPQVELDGCVIFAAGGGPGPTMSAGTWYPLPLLANVLPFPLSRRAARRRRLLCGFAGRETHPLRTEIIQKFRSEPGFSITATTSNRPNPADYWRFRQMLRQSEFSLAPRGFGPASFRMYEALSAASIPVYVSDEFWLPFRDTLDWEKLAVLVKPEELGGLPRKLRLLSENGQAERMRHDILAQRHRFTWRGILHYIEETISDLV